MTPRTPTRPHFVLVGDRAYPLDVLLAALNQAAFRRVDRVLATALTVRQLARQLEGLKTKSHFDNVQREALDAVRASGPGITLEEALKAGEIAATFPWAPAVQKSAPPDAT